VHWEGIDGKLERVIGKEFVSCAEGGEFGDIVRNLLKEFPDKSLPEIGDIVWKCCQEVGNPSRREDFIACLKKYLQQE